MRGSFAHVGVGGVLHTGRELEVREALALPAFGGLSFPEPVAVAVTIGPTAGGLAVRGMVRGVARGECDRCLEPVDVSLDLAIDERFDPSVDDGPFGESNVLAGEELDLQDLVRQLIDSAVPIATLCNATCPGLCATCGYKRDGACRCAPLGDNDGESQVENPALENP